MLPHNPPTTGLAHLTRRNAIALGGAYPAVDPVSPGDLAATIFTMFGISPLTEVHDASGRPYRVAEGRSINEVMA